MGRTSTLSGVGTCKTEQALLDDAYDESQGDTCPDCGGRMEWCDSCRMWSQYCCEEFGTCQCE